MICIVTHCAGHISTNTSLGPRPKTNPSADRFRGKQYTRRMRLDQYQLHWGDWEVGTAILSGIRINSA